MLFSGKKNVFMCLVAFQKMFRKLFSGVWLCSWKYHRKHIFYLLLTFSHIFSVAKRIYNIIHSSIQKHKQNPEKKNHQIRSNWEKKEQREVIGFDEGLQSARCFVRSRSARRRDRDQRSASCHLGDIGGQFRRTISAILADDLDDRSFGRSRRAQLSLWRDWSWAKALYSLFFLSLSLSFARDSEMVWR